MCLFPFVWHPLIFIIVNLSTFSVGRLTPYIFSSDLLWSGRSGVRIPVGGRSFPHPSRPALAAYPASYALVTRSSLAVKQLGHGVDHLPPYSAKIKERVELYLYSPSGPLWPVLGWTLVFVFSVISFLCINLSYYSVHWDLW